MSTIARLLKRSTENNSMHRLVSLTAVVILALTVSAAAQTSPGKSGAAAEADHHPRLDPAASAQKNPPSQATKPDVTAGASGTPGSRRSCCRLCRGCAASDPGAPHATATVIQQPGEKTNDEERESLLKASVPLLQSLLWVLLIGVILIAFRGEIAGVVRGRHFRLKILDFEIEIFPAEQATGTEDLPVEEVPFE
jgi:hypothetical protein